MRTSLAGRPRPAGLASRLLLALALCACGGGDDTGGAQAGEDTQRQAALSTAAATDTCTGPPPSYAQTVLTGPWQALLDSLAANGVSFDSVPGNDTTAVVKLCRNCDSVAVEIRSSNLTPCLSPGDLRGQQTITGMFIVRDTFPQQQQWDTLYPGDTLFTFTNSIAGPATLVYNRNGTGKASPSNAWMFWYCQDGAQNGKTAQAQWRPRGTPPVDSLPGQGVGGGEDDGGGTYGWMACAAGCCQFYTPPPNENSTQTTPVVASPNAPNTVGYGQSQGPQKPYWCETS